MTQNDFKVSKWLKMAQNSSTISKWLKNLKMAQAGSKV
jgi:hypothetical protein